MKLINKTKRTVISENILEAKTIKQKVLGLTISPVPHAMCFTTRFGIHTFGMKYPIDIVVLDTKQQIVTTKEYLKPNRIFLWNPKYSTIIELPAGSLKKSKTHLSDQLEIC